MKDLVLIAAIGSNRELGKDNKLIWYLPGDLKFFKEKTTGHPIVMGYNTFKSLGRLLPNRKHIVLTHQDIEFPEEVSVFHDKEELLASLKQYDDDVFVIGGASIYAQFIEEASKMFLTEIEEKCSEADVYFPEFNKNEWKGTVIKENEDNGIKYKHLEYRRLYER